MQNIVHHSAGVTDFERTRLQATNSGRSDDRYVFLIGHQDQLSGHVFGNTFGNNGDCADLRKYKKQNKKTYHFCVFKKKDDNFIEKKKLQRRYLREIHGLDGTIVSGS